MARSLGLETADREESQDFIDGGDYSILFDKDEIQAGEIVDENRSGPWNASGNYSLYHRPAPRPWHRFPATAVCQPNRRHQQPYYRQRS